MVCFLFRHPDWTHEVWYICNKPGTFKDLADELNATGVFAAKVREEEELKDRPLKPKEWGFLIQTIQKVAEHGYPKMVNTDMVDRWRDDDTGTMVNEIRKGPVRVFFFEDQPRTENRELILTHGFFKKGDDTPDDQVTHYLNLRAAYFEWKFEA